MNGAQLATETHRTGFQKKDQGKEGYFGGKKLFVESLCHEPSVPSV